MIITKAIERIEAAKKRQQAKTPNALIKRLIEEVAEEEKQLYTKLLIIKSLN